MAAELVHADLKRDPGPGGGLGKDQAQGFALEDRVRPASFDISFERVGQIKQIEDFLGGGIIQTDEMLHGAATSAKTWPKSVTNASISVRSMIRGGSRRRVCVPTEPIR